MTYFHLLRCALLLATGSIFVACSQKPSAAESVQTANPPLDNHFADTELQVGRFASRHGALGHYYDENSGSFVLVFPADVTMLPREQIATELETEVRAEHVDMTKEIYDSIESEVVHLHSLHRGSTYAVYLDLPTGRAVLSSDLPRGVLEPLLQKYPDLIEFMAGSIRTDTARQ